MAADAARTIQEEGISDPECAKELKAIWDELLFAAKARNASSQTTMAVAEEMAAGLKHTISQIDKAFKSTNVMYQISFYLGVLLIVAAAASALFSDKVLLSAIFGTIGTIDILTFFLTRPQEELQSSRANLAQIQAALYNWFINSANLNNILAKDIERAPSISELQMAHTEKTLEMLEKYCKLTRK